VVELENGRKILIEGLTRSHRERYLTAFELPFQSDALFEIPQSDHED
jgi:hypothetical protein